MRILRQVHVVPRRLMALDNQGLNPAPGDAVSLTGTFGSPGSIFYNDIQIPYTSWGETQIDLIWPEIPFGLPETNWQTTGYDTGYDLRLVGAAGLVNRQISTKKVATDEFFTVSAISGTGIFANDTNVDIGDQCLLRTDSGTLGTADTDGDLITSLPYTGRYQIWDGTTWAAEEAMVTIS